MEFVLVFLAGLIVGEITSHRPTVTMIDGNDIVAQVSTQDQLLVIKDQDQVQLRKVLAVSPNVKKEVVNPGPTVFRKDSFGGWTVDCKTCVETDEDAREKVIWESSSVSVK